VGGHKYAIQIVTDVPHFGGASGSTLEEAQSWGKLAADAAQVTVHADATVALPILATALSRSSSALASARKRPVMDPSLREMVIDGTAISRETFEETE
jgi:deoxyhypusine synthase